MKRIFILLLIIPLCTLCTARNREKTIVILHTNDTHSQIETIRTGKGRNLGGVARREEYVAKVRKENRHVILLDAGDYNQGTPYFTVFKGDMEIEIMNALRYDVVALGNHEFDNGQDELARRLSKARFRTVCANYDFGDSPIAQYVKPYTIIKKAGKKIGIFGLTIDISSVVAGKARGGISYYDAIEVGNAIAAKLKNEEKCDLVIALTHIGYSGRNPNQLSDVSLAEKSENIDIIIGGHSHTFLDTEKVFKNKSGKDVIVVQDGCNGEYVGRFDITF